MCKNIQYITDNALCTACGTCYAVCPQKAIRITKNNADYLQVVVCAEQCDNCGQCIKVCPSYSENQTINASAAFFEGTVLEAYIGYTNNPADRENSQSGGVVTALLQYLLDGNNIDGAVVTDFNYQTRRPETLFTDSPEKIKASQGSYYTQTAVNKTIFEHREKRLAAVVLGCQAEGLRLLSQSKHAIDAEYKIGLICSGQQSGLVIDDLISQCKPEDKNEFRFRFRFKRKKGYQDMYPRYNIKISTIKNDYTLPNRKRLFAKRIYEHYRCLSCYDKLNIYTDIVCGDPWGIPIESVSDGYTVIIVRTNKGRNLIQNAIKDKIITCIPVEQEKIFAGQGLYSELLPRFRAVKEYSDKNNWRYPYTVDNFDVPNSAKAYTRMYKKTARRLIYSRKFYFSKTDRDVVVAIKQKRMALRLRLFLSCFYRILRVVPRMFKNNAQHVIRSR